MFKLTFARVFYLCACITAAYGEAVFSGPLTSWASWNGGSYSGGYGGGGTYAVSKADFNLRHYQFASLPTGTAEVSRHTDVIIKEGKPYLDLIENLMLMEDKSDIWVNQDNFVAEIKINPQAAAYSESLPLEEWLNYDLVEGWLGDDVGNIADKKKVRRRLMKKMRKEGMQAIENIGGIKPEISRSIMSFYRMCVDYKPNKRSECEKRKIARLKRSLQSLRLIDDNDTNGRKGSGIKRKKLQVRVLGSCSNVKHINANSHKHRKGIDIINNALDKSSSSILIMPNNVAPVRAKEDGHIILPMVVDSVLKKEKSGNRYIRKQKTSDMTCHATDYLLNVGKRVQYHINIGSAEGVCQKHYLTGEESACIPESKESLVFIIEQENKTKVYILHDIVNVNAQCVAAYHWQKWFGDMLNRMKNMVLGRSN